MGWNVVETERPSEYIKYETMQGSDWKMNTRREVERRDEGLRVHETYIRDMDGLGTQGTKELKHTVRLLVVGKLDHWLERSPAQHRRNRRDLSVH